MPPNVTAPLSEEERALSDVALTIVNAPDVEASDVDRFFNQVRAIGERRAQAGWESEGDGTLAVFVRARYPRAAAATFRQSTPCADFAATTEPILGQLHLLNFDASQGRSIPLPSSNAGEVLDWISEQPFAGEQILILYRESLQLIERANGAEGETTRQVMIRAEPPDITEEELFKALELFHLREVLTPSLCPKDVWRPKHAHDYHPGPRPEKAIQDQLKTWLGGWWHGKLRPECEDSIGIGRIDIRLLRPDPAQGSLAYWCIVELKVVKSFHHPKAGDSPTSVSEQENVDAVVKGVEQASDFARDRGVFGILEIYDQRRDKSTDPCGHALVLQALKDHQPNPILRLRPLFGSADDARHAGWAA